MAYKWHFVRLNKDVLVQLLHEGGLFSIEGSIFILTKPEKQGTGLGVHLRFCMVVRQRLSMACCNQLKSCM